METLPSPLRDLARRMLAASQTGSDSHIPIAEIVIERLRVSLTKLAGAEGFASLLRRALALARVDVPSLKGITVGADGRLQGLDSFAADSGAGAERGGANREAEEAAVAITAHLLGLLVTFIGEPITLRLVRESWPDASLGDLLPRSEGGL